MSHYISIKDFRAQLADIADVVEKKGETFIVMRRSHRSFKIVPIDYVPENEKWETVIDFTEGGKSKGIKIEDALQALSELNK